MLGAIAGDIIGSVHEWQGTKFKLFPLWTDESRFTDDSVLTVAVAEVLLDGGDYIDAFHRYVQRYPNAGYGGNFFNWAISRSRRPYNSCGNGSAMRTSPIGWAFDSLDETLAEAERLARITHNHPEGIKGATATAAAIFLARTGTNKPAIKHWIESTFGYDLNRRLAEIRPHYTFDVLCQGSVPESIISFLEAEDYEDTIRNAISLGGDCDTMACVAGGIAQAFYGPLPEAIRAEALRRLDEPLRDVVLRFEAKYSCR